MADNYLEIRMEELRSGRLASRLKSFKGSRKPSGQKFYIPDITVVNLSAVRQSIRRGNRIWFSGGENPIEASRLARTIGAKYLPPTLAPPEDCLVWKNDV